MKIRLLPVFVSLTITSIVLFGGWFAYRSIALEQPLSTIVHPLPGVVDSNMEVDQYEVSIDLVLSSEANILEIMNRIREDGSQFIEDRTLSVNLISEKSSADLDEWWSQQLFDVAEAMELRHYSQIPEVLKARIEQLPGLEVFTSMDEDNVYVKLVYGDANKFVILPRIPVTLRGSLNE